MPADCIDNPFATVRAARMGFGDNFDWRSANTIASVLCWLQNSFLAARIDLSEFISSIANMAASKHALFVCTTCASTWENGQRVGTSGGERFLELLAPKHQEWELREEFPLYPAACMSACSRPCAIAFAAPGKHTFVFGDLQPEAETAAAVLACARQYREKADGLLAWKERPEKLKSGVIARIPPLPKP